MIIDLRKPEYIAPEAIQAYRENGSVVVIEPDRDATLFSLLAAQIGPYVPPVVPFDQRYAEWLESAVICLLHVQDALIVDGQFQKAETLSKEMGGHWWIRWRAGAGVFLKRNHPLLIEFAETLHKDGASEWLDGLAGWDLPRPEPEGEE